jgi:enoyl-CoA hydratase/carnithine racemase
MTLEYQVSEGIATVTLNRPHRRNAFTLDMLDAWADALDEAARDDAVRVVIIVGAGDHFCSGVDLDQLADLEPTPIARKRLLTDHVHRVVRGIARLDKPIVAALRGHAVGAGLDLALMCDMRFAGTSARLAEGYIRIGMVPGAGGCYLLPRLVGVAKALELLLTGDTVDAAEALRIGLVNRVYDDEVLIEETYDFAGRVAATPPVAAQLIKRATYQSARSDLATSLDLVSSHMAVVLSMEDTATALAAFRNGGQAEYHGR